MWGLRHGGELCLIIISVVQVAIQESARSAQDAGRFFLELVMGSCKELFRRGVAPTGEEDDYILFFASPAGRCGDNTEADFARS